MLTDKCAHGQELETGFISGLGDFLYSNAPYAVDMGPAKYDDYYRQTGALSLV